MSTDELLNRVKQALEQLLLNSIDQSIFSRKYPLGTCYQ